MGAFGPSIANTTRPAVDKIEARMYPTNEDWGGNIDMDQLNNAPKGEMRS